MDQQISQQQAIYNRVTNLAVRLFKLFSILCTGAQSFIKSSFDMLLRLHEVIMNGKVSAGSADVWTEIPSGEEQAEVHYGAAIQDVLRGQ